MIGRPFRMEWHEKDTQAALKDAYLSQRDASIRTRLHVLWLADHSGGRGCGSSLSQRPEMGGVVQRRRPQRKLCLARWEAWVSPVI